MKNILILLLGSAMLISACKKSRNEKPQPESDPVMNNPEMNYRQLTDVSIGPGESIYFDFDQNGRRDLIFRTEAQAYDGNTKSRIAYLVDASAYCHIAIDTINETTVKLNSRQSITLADLKNLIWLNANTAYMMSKVYANNTTSWEGSFKSPAEGYLPFHFTTAGKKYLGWIEVSANLTTERIIFHRVAISKEPVEKIYAGM